MSDRIFIGRIEKKDTQYGQIIKVGINKDDIQKLQDNLSERGWVNLVIKERDGRSWMEVDTWKPKNQLNSQQNDNEETDNSPF